MRRHHDGKPCAPGAVAGAPQGLPATAHYIYRQRAKARREQAADRRSAVVFAIRPVTSPIATLPDTAGFLSANRVHAAAFGAVGCGFAATQ
ncbi:hypothetical protein [Pandoraea sp. CB10b_02]|uniref:hypothetical protein n=1 Tax=Pandoraea sp. CB10b_02 TaxID=2014535 RepID=UPI00257E4819|nr:hypothetical protein [Pandoraea sp. CB10b_02]